MYFKNDHEMLIAFWWLLSSAKQLFWKTWFSHASMVCQKTVERGGGEPTQRGLAQAGANDSRGLLGYEKQKPGNPGTALCLSTYSHACFVSTFSYAAITCGYKAHGYRHQIPEQKLGGNHNCTKIQWKEMPCLHLPVRADSSLLASLHFFKTWYECSIVAHSVWGLRWCNLIVFVPLLSLLSFCGQYRFAIASLVLCLVLAISTHCHLIWRNCHLASGVILANDYGKAVCCLSLYALFLFKCNNTS